jgi:hypothetical protein
VPTNRKALAPETRARYDHAIRLKRFEKLLERWCRGEPVRSYDTKWLAYLKEHRPIGFGHRQRQQVNEAATEMTLDVRSH